MAPLELQIDVAAPLDITYRQWTLFERLPEYGGPTQEIEHLDEMHLRGRMSIAGVETEWECEITEIRPEERIAWRGIRGPMRAGMITFHRLDERLTRLTYTADVDADGYLGLRGRSLPLYERELMQELEGFKRRIEAAPRFAHASPSASYSRR